MSGFLRATKTFLAKSGVSSLHSALRAVRLPWRWHTAANVEPDADRAAAADLAMSARLGDCRATMLFLALAWIVCGGRVWLEREGVPSADVSSDFQTPPPRLLIDVNTASTVELQLLPRVGPKLAQRIVDVRERSGPFASHDQIARRVPGVGPTTLRALRPYLVAIEPSASVSAEPSDSKRSP